MNKSDETDHLDKDYSNLLELDNDSRLRILANLIIDQVLEDIKNDPLKYKTSKQMIDILSKQ